MPPQQWLTWFYGNCTSCHFDFQPFHIYDCNAPYFDALAVKYWVGEAAKFKLPIWLREFNCPFPPKREEIELQWMKSVLPYFDFDPRIERYSWFTARQQILAHIPLY